MIWFTADTHFDHTAIMRYCERPWDDIGRMNEVLIENWNTVVSPQDDVYHLGDFAFSKASRIEELIGCLNGRIHFIRGNHDGPIGLNWKRGFIWVKDYYELKVDDEEMNERQRIVLCHYPIESWNGRYHGAWMLHGHSHGTVPSSDKQARLDVGVDCNRFFPVSYDEVKFRMTRKVFKPVCNCNPKHTDVPCPHGN